MKNIVPVILIASSTLLACNNKTAQHTAARQQELGTVMNLPRDGKQIAPQDNIKNTPIVGISDTMEEERKEEFVANGGTAHGDTSSAIEDSADIYYTEFIQPGPH